MGLVTLPDTLVNETIADATKVMANLNALLTEINGLLDAANLENDAITTAKILNAAVIATKLATDAVETLKIKDAAVTTEKLADDSVTDDKLNADCAGAGLTQDGNGALQVNVDDSTIEVADDVVQVKDDGIDSEHLAPGGIDTEHIGNNQVTSDKLNMGQGLVDNANAVDVDGIVEQGTGAHELKPKILDLPEWNMDTSSIKSVAHGLGANWKKILMYAITIRNDADDKHHITPTTTEAGGAMDELGIVEINATNVIVNRRGGGAFDANEDYDGEGFSRGSLIIWYEV